MLVAAMAIAKRLLVYMQPPTPLPPREGRTPVLPPGEGCSVAAMGYSDQLLLCTTIPHTSAAQWSSHRAPATSCSQS